MKRIKNMTLAAFLFWCAAGTGQTFTVQSVGDSVSYGKPGGNDIVVKADIINTGTVDVEIDVIRKENNLPSGWQSYICTDVCLATFADSTRLYLPAGATQPFRLSFMVNNAIDTANCLIRFKNISNGSNSIQKRMYGITDVAAGIKENSKTATSLKIFPGIASDILWINAGENLTQISCVNAEGKEMKVILSKNNTGCCIGISGLAGGIYFLRAITENGRIITSDKFIKE
jgi:hypothetical protein